MKDHKPIKRNKAFVELSKDHHFSLLLVWKIRRDLTTSISDQLISRYVIQFFEDDLRQHFKEEEEIVFNKLPDNDPLRQQAEKEHRDIYQLIDLLRKNDNGNNLLKQFADLLEAHVRFEERVLFNHLQEVLPPEELEAIAMHIKKRDVKSNL